MLDTGAPPPAAMQPRPMARLRRSLRRATATRPALYLPLRRVLRADGMLDHDTALVLDGVPRCGNTWTEFALYDVAPPDFRMAHHSHAAAHVIAAIRRGVPALVLFRDPDAAVASLIAMGGGLRGARDGFRDYSAFYGALVGQPRARIVFASFDDVTNRMSAVIETLNTRFGLGFSPFDDTCEQTRTRLNARIQARARVRGLSSRCTPGHGTGDRAAAQAAVLAPEAGWARLRAHQVFALLRSDIGADA
ncbi:MAG: hypothetical protein JXJ18_06035 [Rhodobacteraceae bacterium]|nr:hypothetical protein [Paracoccaceae bacterium]